MKKIAITFALAILFAVCTQAQTPEVKKSDATVNQMQGLYIFNNCKPQAEYTYLGTTTKIKVCWTCQPEELMDIILKKVRNEYPQADGIIFNKLNMESADVIKFK